MNAPLLKVEDLRIALQGDGVVFNAVEDVSFEIGRGEAFGLVGESGCGKSITAPCSTARKSRTHRPPRCAACAASVSP